MMTAKKKINIEKITHTPQQPLSNKKSEVAQLSSSDLLFKEFAKKAGYAKTVDIFREHDPERKNMLLAQFSSEAIIKGQSHLSVALTFEKYRYPVKIANYIPCDKDQAAAIIGFMGTGKVDLFEAFLGGVPIIEYGMLLNGVFGKRMIHRNPESIDIGTEVADWLYLIKHCQSASLPQSPFIVFLEKARILDLGDGTSLGDEMKNFKEAKERVLAHREKAEARMKGSLTSHYFKVQDETHNCSTKFRMVCMVYNMEDSRFYVVSSDEKKNPQSFSAWASDRRNLNDILSCGDDELDLMAGIAENGLMDKLRNPPIRLVEIKREDGSIGLEERIVDPDYHPWSDLLDEVKDYRLATNIWRYAMIKLMAEKAEKAERVARKIAAMPEAQEYSAVKETVMKHKCDDARQGGNYATLGAMVTQNEYKDLMTELTDNKGPNAEAYRVAGHYKCGFVTACFNIHQSFRNLGIAITDERKRIHAESDAQIMDARRSGAPGSNETARRAEKAKATADFNYGRNIRELRFALTKVLKNEGPVKERIPLREYLPAGLHGEYDNYVASLSGDELKDTAAALHMLFGENARSLVEFVKEGQKEKFLEYVDEISRIGKVEEVGQNRKLAGFMHRFFVSNDETLRAVVRRGMDVEILSFLENDEQKPRFIEMPAAKMTFKKLREYFFEEGNEDKDHGFGAHFNDAQLASLVLEEAFRQYGARLAAWKRELPREHRIEYAMILENFSNGQSTIIPEAPMSKEDFLDLKRDDYFLTKYFSPREIKEYGLEKYVEIDMPY